MVTLGDAFHCYPSQSRRKASLQHDFLFCLGIMAPSSFSSAILQQSPIKSILLAGWGSRPWAPLLCRLISFYSCNVLTICHSLISGNRRSLNFELRSSNHVCLPPTAGAGSGSPVATWPFSPAENSLPLSLSVWARDADSRWRMGRCLEERSVTNNSSVLSYWSASCQLRKRSGSYAS